MFIDSIEYRASWLKTARSLSYEAHVQQYICIPYSSSSLESRMLSNPYHIYTPLSARSKVQSERGTVEDVRRPRAGTFMFTTQRSRAMHREDPMGCKSLPAERARILDHPRGCGRPARHTRRFQSPHQRREQ